MIQINAVTRLCAAAQIELNDIKVISSTKAGLSEADAAKATELLHQAFTKFDEATTHKFFATVLKKHAHMLGHRVKTPGKRIRIAVTNPNAHDLSGWAMDWATILTAVLDKARVGRTESKGYTIYMFKLGTAEHAYPTSSPYNIAFGMSSIGSLTDNYIELMIK